MPTQVPSIDSNACSGWNQQDINLYNKLPFYFAKMQVSRRDTYHIWSKFFGKRPWTPNMGSTMRGVRKEPSPNIRQFAFPNEICTLPKVDVTDVREMTVDAAVYRHRFESQVMNFCPNFRDFFNDHVEPQRQDLMEKMERFEDIYLRGNVYYLSPNVWLPNRNAGELVQAPRALGNQANTAVNSKNISWAAATLPQIGNPGNLGLATVNKAMVAMEVDLRVPAFSGSSGMPKDGVGMQDKFVLVCSSEAWNQFTFDPYLQANKNCDLDVVNQSFKGSLFGRVTCRLEDLPIRISADGTIPQPETREGNTEAYNLNETVLSQAYIDAPYEVAFLCGTEGYDMIRVGPPPSVFKNNGMADGFGKMFWNGELILTKNFLIECLADDGSTKYMANTYGEDIKAFGQATYGVLPKQRRNIVPIIFKRVRGPQ